MATALYRVIQGDVREKLRELEPESVQMSVTSPPYWGLRDYGTEPQVWQNTKPLCEKHEWGKSLTKKKSGGIPQNGTGSYDGGVGRGPRAQDSKHQFCLHCNAWLGSLGLEPTPEMYVQHLVEIFRAVRRVLKQDGTLWLNLGDTYAGSGRGRDADGTWNPGKGGSKQETNVGAITGRTVNSKSLSKKAIEVGAIGNAWTKPPQGWKCKDLIGIPWMVAFALRADGWWLRSDIIWHKPNPMPESVKDRPTRAHEYIFLLTKSERYYYDGDAIKEPAKESSIKRFSQPTDEQTGGEKDYGLGLNTNRSARRSLENFKRKAVKFGGEKAPGHGTRRASGKEWNPKQGGGGNGFKGHSGNQLADGTFIVDRNKRDVWTVTTKPFKGAHFATFPADLIEPCIRAGSKEGDTVLDPFVGSGTTLEVAERLGRNSIGIELNEKYMKEIIEPRMAKVHPLFNAVAPITSTNGV